MSVPKYFVQDSDSSSSSSSFDDKGSYNEEEVKEHVDLRAPEEKTDFAIKVGGKNFNVHRKCLMEHSEYFRTKLTNGTKESQQGYVEIENLSEHAVLKGLDFIYKGTVVAEPENVEELLHAAELMQLDPIKNACFVTLEKNLKSANCITVYNLAKKYGRLEAQNKAKTIFVSTYDLDEIEEFLEFSAKQVVEFLTKLDLGNEILWDSISNWIKVDCDIRKENINDMILIFNWDNFPSGQLLNCLWNGNLFKESESCKDKMFCSIFLDLESLEVNLCTENYFIIKKIAGEFKYTTKQTKKMLLQFFIRNFTLLVRQKEFLLLEEKEILEIYRAGNADILTREKWRYIAAENWVKYDPKRISVLPNLLRTIKFDQISSAFLRVIDDNRDLMQTARCSKIFTEGVFSQLERPRKGKSIAVLYSDGRARILDPILKTITRCPSPPSTTYNFVSLNDKLCAISEFGLFYLSNEGKWVPKLQFNDVPADKVITIEDCIYFPQSSYRYNAEKNALESASEENKLMLLNGKVNYELLLQNSDGNIVVAGDGNIFSVATTRNNARENYLQVLKFDINSNQWKPYATTTLEEEVTAKSSISIGDAFYMFGNQSAVWKIEKKHKKVEVFYISDIPLSQSTDKARMRKESGRFEYQRVSRAKVTKKWPLNINDRLAVLTETTALFVYDELCDTWLEPMETPQYISCRENRNIEVKIVSACTFTNDY